MCMHETNNHSERETKTQGTPLADYYQYVGNQKIRLDVLQYYYYAVIITFVKLNIANKTNMTHKPPLIFRLSEPLESIATEPPACEGFSSLM